MKLAKESGGDAVRTTAGRQHADYERYPQPYPAGQMNSQSGLEPASRIGGALALRAVTAANLPLRGSEADALEVRCIEYGFDESMRDLHLELDLVACRRPID